MTTTLTSLASLLPPASGDEKADIILRLLAAVLRGQPASSVSLEQLAALITTGFSDLKTELQTMSDAFATEITKLTADVAAQGTVIASATLAFQGLAAQLAAAEAAARAAGATDAQVAGLAAVRQGLETNTAALTAAIPANTSAADQSGTPPAPAPAGAPTGTGTAI
jgi:hypothetical protein